MTPPPADSKGYRSEPRCTYRTLRQNRKLLCTPRTYTEDPLTAEMANVMGEIMAGVLSIFAITTGDEARTNEWVHVWRELSLT